MIVCFDNSDNSESPNSFKIKTLKARFKVFVISTLMLGVNMAFNKNNHILFC